MTDRPLKVGMIGAGFILRPHALAVAAVDGAILHAVADTSARRAQEAARQFGFAHALASVEAMAASDCDVVHVLVPPFLHIPIAETLIKAGKSVFLEKPMGLSSAECGRLGALGDRRGVRLGVNHNFLFAPGYERLRDTVKQGELGRLDHISCSWNFELPQVRGGPFDAWMLSAPANLFFELGPHVAAFLLDLLGGAKVKAAACSRPLQLPTGQTAYRSWAAFGEHEAAGFQFSVSTSPGHADRLLRVRASGGSAQLDFGRDIYWKEGTDTANPMFDSHAVAKGIAVQVGSVARRDRRRRVIAALRKSLDSEPFTETMGRSIARFYSMSGNEVDGRQHWRFGAKVIEFCETVCDRAGAGAPSLNAFSMAAPHVRSSTPASVLVVGGTGFIGRRLVAKLIEQGAGVRVLSRSQTTAAIAFAGMPVDIRQGFHGDPEIARAALDGIDTVYHLAKCEGKRWEDYVQGDIEPTRVLAEAAVAAGVKRFIYTGTIDSYDSASPRNRITGDTPLDRNLSERNLYARSKGACEALLRDMSSDKRLPLIVMRPAIVIGAGTDPSHLGVAQFASETEVRFWGNGRNKLPLVLVDDVADALVKAKDAPGVIGKCFLLTSPPLLSARDYVAEVSARSGVKIHSTDRSPFRYWTADFIKEAAKNLVRHPNRRKSTLHDWACRTQRSTYDSSAAERDLDWHPANDREALVKAGIHDAVDAEIGREGDA